MSLHHGTPLPHEEGSLRTLQLPCRFLDPDGSHRPLHDQVVQCFQFPAIITVLLVASFLFQDPYLAFTLHIPDHAIILHISQHTHCKAHCPSLQSSGLFFCFICSLIRVLKYNMFIKWKQMMIYSLNLCTMLNICLLP